MRALIHLLGVITSAGSAEVRSLVNGFTRTLVKREIKAHDESSEVGNSPIGSTRQPWNNEDAQGTESVY